MAYKSWKPKGTNYIDIRGITFGKWEIPRHKMGVTYGYRNLYYYIGKLNKVTSGYSNVSCLVLYFSNWENYNQAVPAIVTITKNRTLITRLGDGQSNSDNWKSIYVYEDAEYYWIFVKAPNYHDSWYYEIIEERNVSDIQKDYRMTETDFNTFISSHNLTLTRINNNMGYGSNNYYTSESVVGTWIDGKPLYRKVVSKTGISAGKSSIVHGISNAKDILIKNSYFVNDNGISYSLPIYLYNSGTVSDPASVSVDRSSVYFYSTGAWGTSWKAYIVLEYTKTTD